MKADDGQPIVPDPTNPTFRTNCDSPSFLNNNAKKRESISILESRGLVSKNKREFENRKESPKLPLACVADSTNESIPDSPEMKIEDIYTSGVDEMTTNQEIEPSGPLPFVQFEEENENPQENEEYTVKLRDAELKREIWEKAIEDEEERKKEEATEKERLEQHDWELQEAARLKEEEEDRAMAAKLKKFEEEEDKMLDYEGMRHLDHIKNP